MGGSLLTALVFGAVWKSSIFQTSKRLLPFFARLLQPRRQSRGITALSESHRPFRHLVLGSRRVRATRRHPSSGVEKTLPATVARVYSWVLGFMSLYLRKKPLHVLRALLPVRRDPTSQENLADLCEAPPLRFRNLG
jgi:hypothetical protein